MNLSCVLLIKKNISVDITVSYTLGKELESLSPSLTLYLTLQNETFTPNAKKESFLFSSFLPLLPSFLVSKAYTRLCSFSSCKKISSRTFIIPQFRSSYLRTMPSGLPKPFSSSQSLTKLLANSSSMALSADYPEIPFQVVRDKPLWRRPPPPATGNNNNNNNNNSNGDFVDSLSKVRSWMKRPGSYV